MPRRPLTAVLAALAAAAALAACTSGAPADRPAASTAGSTAASSPVTSPRTTPSTPTPRPTRPQPKTSSHQQPQQPRTKTHDTPTPTTSPAAQQLPLDLPTHDARQVVTVVAGSSSDTEGTLQAWRRVPGGWRAAGPELHAWLGTDGMTDHPSEQNAAAPEGSYPLTQAFGRDSDPGTRLPYRQTTPADWWISESGPLYNTLQHCTSDCGFTQGAPNEHLYDETPYYNYAVVIDYNRAPVRQGAGSAFFLHVTVGAPTQGCVSIDQDELVRILRWLRPAAHPRILIGTG